MSISRELLEKCNCLQMAMLETKDEIIALYKRVNAMREALLDASEFANSDDVNGQAGCIARDALLADNKAGGIK